MTEVEVRLRQEEAKLVFLAVAYHLGRPGSELDPITKQPVERGLAETARELQPQLRLALSRLRLGEAQIKRLLSAMLGSITELKAYRMLEASAVREGGAWRSTVPGFDGTLRHLFPEVDEDAEAAIEIAERMLLLKRRLDERLAELPPPQPPANQRRGFWPFRR